MEIEIEELKSKIRGLKFCLKNCYIVENQQRDTIKKLNHKLDVTDEYVEELKVKLNMVNDILDNTIEELKEADEKLEGLGLGRHESPSYFPQPHQIPFF